MSKTPFKREYSAGGCVYKQTPDTSGKSPVLWLLGKHSGYHKWVLPKGMIEPGETAQATAVRETQEEIGVTGKIVDDQPIHVEKYWFVAELKGEDKLLPDGNVSKSVRRVKTYQEDPGFSSSADKIKVFKTVNFYLMEYVSGDPKDHGWEMEDAGWFELEEALELMSFDGEKTALQLAAQKLSTP